MALGNRGQEEKTRARSASTAPAFAALVGGDCCNSWDDPEVAFFASTPLGGVFRNSKKTQEKSQNTPDFPGFFRLARARCAGLFLFPIPASLSWYLWRVPG